MFRQPIKAPTEVPSHPSEKNSSTFLYNVGTSKRFRDLIVEKDNRVRFLSTGDDMRDLELWRLLQAGGADVELLLPLLGELAECELSIRVPFLGLVSECLDHEDSRLRKSAIHCLAGAAGSLAFRGLVRVLGDTQADVREAAIEALRTSALHDPARWAHVLFHHDPAIRRAGLEGQSIPGAEWFAVYLLSDPHCEESAVALLLERSGSIPSSTLPALIEMVQRGRLDRELARQLITHISPQERDQWFEDSQQRSPNQVQVLLNHAPSSAADDSLAITKTVDALDSLIDLFWEADLFAPANGTQSRREQLFSDFIETLRNDDSGLRLRVAASLLVVAARRGTWNSPALETGVALWPQLLKCGWIPKDQRREALREFYRLGSRCRRESDSDVKQLIQSDLCRHPDGHLDLWAVGGVLHLLENHPYKHLLEWVKINKILTSFWADPERSVPFLSLSDHSEEGRASLLKTICGHRQPQKASLLAKMVHFVPADGYEFLDDLSSEEAVEIFSELLMLQTKSIQTLSENKTRVAAERLGHRIFQGGQRAMGQFLKAWLEAPEPQQFKLGLAILSHLADALPIQELRSVLVSFDNRALRQIVQLIGWCPGFPYGKERQLAEDHLENPDWDIRRWALRCCPTESAEAIPPKVARSLPRTGQDLTDAEADHIATCGESSLAMALKPALETPCRGLSAALARRPDPKTAHIKACTALLGCHDSLRLIREQFERFADWTNEDFREQLERSMVSTWNRRQELPMIGHAWLYRWEAHAFAFAELASRHSDEWEGQLRYATNAASPFLLRRIWSAMARVVGLLRYRDKPRLEESWTRAFAELAAKNLGTPWGPPIAKLLIQAWQAELDPEHFESLRMLVISHLPEMSPEERETLRPWVSSVGISRMPVEPRPVKGIANEDILATIAAATDFDPLHTWCFNENTKIAEEAALRLLEFDEPGAARLLQILTGNPLPSSVLLLAETISLWPEGSALSAVGDVVSMKAFPAQLRFLIGLQLLERGRTEMTDAVLGLVRADSETTWFQKSDWDRLLKAGLKKSQLAYALSASPHPHAYLSAVRWLLAKQETGEDDVAAVRRFLEAGSERLMELRRKAAWWLVDRGDRRGFPLLAQQASQEEASRNPFLGAKTNEILSIVNSALLAGGTLFPEERLFALVDEIRDPWLQHQAFEPMLSRCLSHSIRESIVPRLRRTHSRSLKLRRIAEEFAWGIRMGRELTGRLFSIEMIGGEELGYTRLQESKIYITPMPILRGERNAGDVVRGLILHEYGHHMYHRGEEEEAIWEKAQNEGLGRLLNLVSDEHLERNLRALDDHFGDRLKKLAAYAFQHSKKEMPFEDLLNSLQGRAFEVLVGTRLQVARRRGGVIVDNGQLLLEMEKSGLSFARFVRALRMGLGNRHHDPKVEAGLELFRKKFRKSDMPKLLEISRKLREIFGWECSLLDSFSQEECLSADPSDVMAQGEGITNREVESEIQRITNPRKRRGSSADDEKGDGGRWINVSAQEQFETISTVLPLTFDPKQHVPYAQEVARPARQLRQYLKDLGLAMVQHRMRVAGRLLDRSRIPAVVLRNDPRMLIARQRQTHNDLFLGAVIDCSGSMDYDDNIEKAKMFGALLAEAIQGLAGVDLRLFGFTDSVIYDAGNETRPAVHALRAGGGNNDAAALWHAAQVAMASRRKAKVLVMISDGLPTECSAVALRGLATRLTNRHKLCCAQVAVQPLEEICFPHYILLDEADVGTSVRRFGNTVARLVRRAMSGR